MRPDKGKLYRTGRKDTTFLSVFLLNTGLAEQLKKEKCFRQCARMGWKFTHVVFLVNS